MARRNHKLTFDRALSDREYKLRKAAIDQMNGGNPTIYEPNQPNPVEQQYLSAISLFERKSMTRGIEHLERGDHKALLRLGRSFRKPR